VEADWSVEIGEGLARIEIPWRGAGPGSGCEFVDLVSESDLPATGLSASLARIPEVRHEPVLLHALLLLNGVHSSVCTSKCDLWTIGEEEIDPYEFDADGPAKKGWASYIDFVLRDADCFPSLEWHETWMRRVTAYLREQSLRSARVDFVLREAEVRGAGGFGVTCYAMGCGADGASAAASWASALEFAAEAICDPRFSSALL
jgi:hypothetical protein